MNYFLRRGNEEYGPYTLADLRRFAFTGNAAPSDEVRPETDTVWQPARLVLGSDAWPAATLPAPAPAVPQALPQGAYLPAYQVPVMANGAPLPIDFHWALLLVLTLLTCGMAGYVWLLVQAWWVRKLDPRSNAIWVLVAYVAIGYAAIIPNFAMSFTTGDSADAFTIALFALVMVMSLGSLVLYLVGVFSMRRSMNEYFQRVENIGLHLGPIMTFFFAVYYFQYHMSRIARWKRTGVLL
ncbi:MAG: DUF4339 domain-containing protein [Bryobacterales bacterium]|nr:DUF4339 domain-containing protein [Bryobacterales bacterium]